ncbi:MAG: type II toxin-antitoxin system Phd/YefM family antitoxin [Saprospiraceae bacterium]
MEAITLNIAKNNLENIVQKTIDNQEETLVVTDNGNVVLVEQNEWNSIMETLRLFSDKRSLAALLEGIEARRKGKALKGKTIEEVFEDEL